jgi:hypothetical protein
LELLLCDFSSCRQVLLHVVVAAFAHRIL